MFSIPKQPNGALIGKVSNYERLCPDSVFISCKEYNAFTKLQLYLPNLGLVFLGDPNQIYIFWKSKEIEAFLYLSHLQKHGGRRNM